MIENNFQKNQITLETKNNIVADLSVAIKIAMGEMSNEDFSKGSRINIGLIDDIINQKIDTLPERNILRSIARASQNRITYTYLCYICKYTENDFNEDRMWASFFPERGDVYYVDLGYNMDSEQNGIRPCVIIQNNKGNENAPTIQVAPITSKYKQLLPSHVVLTKNDGMREDSIICLEQIRSVSKRRLFYNDRPNKILQLSKEKIFEVDVAIQKQLGLVGITFDESYANKLISQIKTLEQNIKIKKSKDLINLLNEKVEEFIIYCSKYRKNHLFVMQNYQSKYNILQKAI